jgi:hypothetical protein
MGQFPLALRRYLLATWVIGLLAWVSSWFLRFDHRPLSWPLMGAVLCLLILAQNFPKHVLRGTKVSLNSVPMFIAVLCLPVAAAVSTVLVGMAVAQGRMRRPWYEIGFNMASATLEVYVGGLVYAGLALVSGPWTTLVAAAISAAALYLTNISLVSGAVAAQHHLTYRRIWHEAATAEAFDHVLMFLVGGLLALPLVWKPFMAGLLLLVTMIHTLWTHHQHRLVLTADLKHMASGT